MVCLQDHDQVGNRAAGDRLPEITPHDLLKVGAVLLLTSPFTPMLWMGEEWAASTRWPFFTSHPEPELAEATAAGRLAEFTDHGWDVTEIVDPQDPRTFWSAKLNSGGAHHRTTRRDAPRCIGPFSDFDGTIPLLAEAALDAVDVDYDESAGWLLVHRGEFAVIVNVQEARQLVPVHASNVLFSTNPASAIDRHGVWIPGRSASIVRSDAPALGRNE